MSIQPYLFFEGRCDEAIEFYRGALGAEVEMLMRFKDSPDQGGCPDGPLPDGEKVMHACLKIRGGTAVGLRRFVRREAQLPGRIDLARRARRGDRRPVLRGAR